MTLEKWDRSETPEDNVSIHKKFRRFVDKLCGLRPDGTYEFDASIYQAVDVDEPVAQGVGELIRFHWGPRSLLPLPYKHPDTVNVRPSVDKNIIPQEASVDLFFHYSTKDPSSWYSLNITIIPGNPFVESSVTFHNFRNILDEDFDIRHQEPSQKQWELLYRMLINPFCGSTPDELENEIKPQQSLEQ